MKMGNTKTIILHDVIVFLLLLLCMEMGSIQYSTAQPGNGILLLPTSEVKAIREIAAQLNKKDWNFSDPCSNKTTIERPHTDQYFNTIICNCSISANVCHLQSINLGQNYLSGTIPSEWASTKLETLVLSVNNLTGPIPSFLGRITTLKALGLESNSFSGTIPPEFGNLVNMEIIFLSANNLTGTWPATFANMTNLKTLRISSNNFTGRLPDIFRSWKQLQNFELQGSGFEGPIPSSISVLNNLLTLRISDLKGESSEFPDLRNMNNMQKLMLRSCNIRGRIPDYISTLTNLVTLDLSFNRLEGTIPNFANIMGLSTIFLTSNQLTGLIPDWISSRDNRYAIDLSYNNFTKISGPPACRETFNLFRAFSQQSNKLLAPCLNPCSKDRYSVHINCGGKEVTIGNIKYQADEDVGGSAKFFQSPADWGFSSTGDFWDIWSSTKDHIANNASVLRMKNSELYTTARLSPLSLTYYARCLANGPYTVKLHFAEIILRDNRSYYSDGSRMFDVYVQGKLKLKDFDIEKEAKGVDKEVIRNFTAMVTDKTLDIRFQWAGKGTTNVPRRGMYGSLISAISMESNFKPPDEHRSTKIIVAGVVSALLLILMILVILWWKGYFGGKPSREQRYMAPEYALWGYLTFKADVYSFGIVALELVAGINNMKFRPNEDYLESEFNHEEVFRMIKVALLCTNPSPALRPTMSAVVSMLEGRTLVHELIMDPSVYGDQSRFKALTEYIDHLRSPSSKEPAQQSFFFSSEASSLKLYTIQTKTMASQTTLILLLFMFLFLFLAPFKSKAQTSTLPQDEVEAIKEIATQLNKTDWNFNDPCSNKSTNNIPRTDQYTNVITCNCSISPNNNLCHIQTIAFTGQDLDGELPKSIWKLPHLKEVSKLPQRVISVNNLSGTIPAFLSNMTTLKRLSMESNMFSGTIPTELGKLVNLEYLNLNANNLTGQFPLALTNLTNLKELRISSNNFSGKMPEFNNWKQLQKLEMEASGFNSSIPSSLSNLNSLTELRISDLNGEMSSNFPDLRKMTNLERLMLRSCNLRGNIPNYIRTLTNLTVLDLSFNKLEGPIPNFENIMALDTLYLTSNSLNGPIPDWIKLRDSRYQIDLSYNNFSESSQPSTCRETLILSKCLTPCSKDQYSLYINCGGKQTTIGGITYEGDQDSGGAAKLVHNSPSWGFSSTGDFWDVWSTTKDYIAENVSLLRMNNSELYTTARLSPLSLTYYARCLANGNYTVKLHFAEIVLRDNRSYYGVGRRMFDVYVQGKPVLKDFNIEKEANGVDKEYIKVVKTVVSHNTLEIRLQWAGKGTRNVPKRGMYGSLISAISIKSDFDPPRKEKPTKFIIIGVVSAFCLVLIVLGILWWKGYFRKKESKDEDIKATNILLDKDLTPKISDFGLAKLNEEENTHISTRVAGTIGYMAPEYALWGYLTDKADVYSFGVMALEIVAGKNNMRFRPNENFVCLLDWAIFLQQKGDVMELVDPNLGSKFKKEEAKRMIKVALLCTNPSPSLRPAMSTVVSMLEGRTTIPELVMDSSSHGDPFKFTGLRDKLDQISQQSSSEPTTWRYMAPEYALWGYLTDKADVYSFGVVAMETVAGKNNMKYRPNENFVCLLDWLVDPNLGSQFKKEEAKRMIEVALLCTNPSPSLRPTMSTVVSILEGRTTIPKLDMALSIDDPFMFTGLRNKLDQISQQNSKTSHSMATQSSNSSSWIDSASASSFSKIINKQDKKATLIFIRSNRVYDVQF
ncbi:hypothetical protein G4B88_020372 [Cannabis sativa]|uniref:non-specific serine/threonine protein kinase n=1 Tax=Cannabis sativa TaxID=3483 RepID=A0A7J6ENB6_CANSA|nr:hypothetical protein G4B88_020372 [Cannabis sativa]